MNSFNLYPYNMYILLTAILVMLVFLILTIKRLHVLKQTAVHVQKHKDVIVRGIREAEIKKAVAKESFQKPIQTCRQLMKLFSLAMTIRTSTSIMRHVAKKTYEDQAKD